MNTLNSDLDNKNLIDLLTIVFPQIRDPNERVASLSEIQRQKFIELITIDPIITEDTDFHAERHGSQLLILPETIAQVKALSSYILLHPSDRDMVHYNS